MDEVEQKHSHDYVSYVDKQSEEQLVDALRQLPLKAGFITEEKTVSYQGEEYCWIIDPLDGTKEFIKKNGEFSVNIALIRNTRPYFGLIIAPAKGLICYGFADDKPLFGTIKTEEFIGIEVDQILSLCKPIQSSLQKRNEVTKIGSRSHADPKEQDLINCWLPNKTIESSIQVG
ncbi:MAG TPA: inositol monophosphatase family protein, partial [Bacteroidales bacterium]|nr:inositol monophosphatase family protein [Bacteroidales bacterium]